MHRRRKPKLAEKFWYTLSGSERQLRKRCRSRPSGLLLDEP
jgi:hypothetical protein